MIQDLKFVAYCTLALSAVYAPIAIKHCDNYSSSPEFREPTSRRNTVCTASIDLENTCNVVTNISLGEGEK